MAVWGPKRLRRSVFPRDRIGRRESRHIRVIEPVAACQNSETRVSSIFFTPGEFINRMTFHRPESSNGTPLRDRPGTPKNADVAEVPLSD
jgi:hypothetical protein